MKILKKVLLSGFVLLWLGACEALPSGFYRCQSWAAGALKDGELQTLRVYLAAVSADKSGNRVSIEKEAAGLAPLLFLKYGLETVEEGEQADYTADIRLREREYASGWKTRRSLLCEVRFRKADGAGECRAPAAAGRVTFLGEKSFSSSDTMGRMLALAVRKAAARLEREDR
ncbi:MAG: hypothetical protein LBS06_07245 [Treponema sp.]|jgi:hypothetical protein|nr:hypothetical protein [Treponema sp.]